MATMLTETVTVTHTAALARLGYALSDQTRARVLLALREAPALPSELAQTIGVSRQVMSNQLACLRGCGLVEAVPEGRNVRYRLTDPHLAARARPAARGRALGRSGLLRRRGLRLFMTALPLGPPIRSRRQRVLTRRIRWVVAATISYNVIEAIVALTAGAIASSAALIGFGLDSVVEVLSAAAVAWQFSAPDPHTRERVAMRAIAISFFGLAAFVTVDATRALLDGGAARSLPGRDRARRRQPRGDAAAVVVRAPHRA